MTAISIRDIAGRRLGRAGIVAVAVLGLVATLVLSGCGSAGASFVASGPCNADGRAAGAYPDLEALLPRTLIQRAPDTVNSGRNCSGRALASYASHGVGEIRFAGATWDEGGGNATVIAVFETPAGQPPLDVAWVEEFYLEGARASTKTENIQKSEPTMGDAGQVFRIDTLNDLSFQTVVIWPDDGVVRVVLASTHVEPGGQSRAEHDQRVAIAVDAAAAGPGSS